MESLSNHNPINNFHSTEPVQLHKFNEEEDDLLADFLNEDPQVKPKPPLNSRSITVISTQPTIIEEELPFLTLIEDEVDVPVPLPEVLKILQDNDVLPEELKGVNLPTEEILKRLSEATPENLDKLFEEIEDLNLYYITPESLEDLKSGLNKILELKKFNKMNFKEVSWALNNKALATVKEIGKIIGENTSNSELDPIFEIRLDENLLKLAERNISIIDLKDENDKKRRLNRTQFKTAEFTAAEVAHIARIVFLAIFRAFQQQEKAEAKKKAEEEKRFGDSFREISITKQVDAIQIEQVNISDRDVKETVIPKSSDHQPQMNLEKRKEKIREEKLENEKQIKIDEINKKDIEKTNLRRDIRKKTISSENIDSETQKEYEKNKEVEKREIGKFVKEKVKVSDNPDELPIDIVDFTKEKTTDTI